MGRDGPESFWQCCPRPQPQRGPCLPTPLFPRLLPSPCCHQLVPKAGPGQRREQSWGLGRGGSLLSWKPGLWSWLFALLPPLRILSSTISGALQPRLPLTFKSPISSSLSTSARSSRAPLLLASSITRARKGTQGGTSCAGFPGRVGEPPLSCCLCVGMCRSGAARVRAVGYVWTLLPPAPTSTAGIRHGGGVVPLGRSITRHRPVRPAGNSPTTLYFVFTGGSRQLRSLPAPLLTATAPATAPGTFPSAAVPASSAREEESKRVIVRTGRRQRNPAGVAQATWDGICLP